MEKKNENILYVTISLDVILFHKTNVAIAEVSLFGNLLLLNGHDRIIFIT